MATKVEMAAEDLVYALMDEAKLTEAQEQALHQSGAVDRAIVIARTRVAAALNNEHSMLVGSRYDPLLSLPSHRPLGGYREAVDRSLRHGGAGRARA